MEKNIIFTGAIFLIVGIAMGIIGMSLIGTNNVMVDSIEDSEGNIVGEAISAQNVPGISLPTPVNPTTPTSTSGGKTYTYAGSLNYCVDRNSAVTAYIDWTDEIQNMDLGLNTYKVRLSNYKYYNINFCKVDVGQYEDCNVCWAELEE